MEGNKIKNYILLLICCFPFFLFACGHNEEDTENYSGIIADGNYMGYEYTVTKERNTVSWKVSYNDEPTILKETVTNRDDLISYRNSVNDGKMVLIKLMLSVTYFLSGITIILVLYKKNKQMLKEGGLIIGLCSSIGVFFAIKALLDLSRTIRDTEYFYLTLTI